jgi:hypothetical protein
MSSIYDPRKFKWDYLLNQLLIPDQQIVISDNDPEISEQSPWYIFNDFLVKNVQEGEISQFPNSWKVENIP